MTIANNMQKILMAGKDLREIDYTFNKPFRFCLTNGLSFLAETIIRIIPGRRIVASGTWNGKNVVAKIFLDPRNAKEQMEKEARGNKILQAHKIPTANIYYEDVCHDKETYIIIFEHIENAENADTIWHNRKSMDDVMPMLRSLIMELATQHVMGVVQTDLHLKNFLIGDQTIYTLDSAQIEFIPNLTPIETSMRYLALFLAQLGVGIETYQDELFTIYAKARSWLYTKDDRARLHDWIKKWNKKRWQQYQKKIFRNCTEFAKFDDWRSSGMYAKDFATPTFLNLLTDLDQAFYHPTAELLKVGGSSTVVKIHIDGRDLVVKRYNLKNFGHFLRRCLRSTRALSVWMFANKMKLFEVSTAKPVAFIERQVFGLNQKSYYISEYVPGLQGNDYLEQYADHGEKMNNFIQSVSALLANIKKLGLSHGDLKLSNILIDKNDLPVIIDLDGTKEHCSHSGLHRANRDDVLRFMENFKNYSEIETKFKIELGAASR